MSRFLADLFRVEDRASELHQENEMLRSILKKFIGPDVGVAFTPEEAKFMSVISQEEVP